MGKHFLSPGLHIHHAPSPRRRVAQAVSPMTRACTRICSLGLGRIRPPMPRAISKVTSAATTCQTSTVLIRCGPVPVLQPRRPLPPGRRQLLPSSPCSHDTPICRAGVGLLGAQRTVTLMYSRLLHLRTVQLSQITNSDHVREQDLTLHRISH